MKILKILIDNGHGVNTLGKCSPDKSLLEYLFNRVIAKMLCAKLVAAVYDAELLTPEDYDVSITERVRRINAWCAKLGAQNVLVVSIHGNAAGNGGWYTARGWLSIVDDAASHNSRLFADLLFDEVKKRGLKARQPSPQKKYYYYSEALGKPNRRLPILRDSRCPAVLTENFFYDNREDLAFMQSEVGKQIIVDIHYHAILEYAKQKSA